MDPIKKKKKKVFTHNTKDAANALDFGLNVVQILEEDKRYDMEAYIFVMNALQYTLGKMDEHRHVSGRELLSGIREFCLLQFGPMSKVVLEHWGVRNTYDFGEIVFKLVDAGMMSRRPEDTIEEFRDVYDFKTAFDKPYRRALSPKIIKKNASASKAQQGGC